MPARKLIRWSPDELRCAHSALYSTATPVCWHYQSCWVQEEDTIVGTLNPEDLGRGSNPTTSNNCTSIRKQKLEGMHTQELTAEGCWTYASTA
jgi:hypothetical protein